MSTRTVRGTVSGMAERANPAFAGAIVVLPLAALGYALTVATVQQHTYVHVMAGLLWTGIDVFMGAVLGPVVGGLDDEQSSAVFQRLTPKMAFLLPMLALVTIAAGIAGPATGTVPRRGAVAGAVHVLQSRPGAVADRLPAERLARLALATPLRRRGGGESCVDRADDRSRPVRRRRVSPCRPSPSR